MLIHAMKYVRKKNQISVHLNVKLFTNHYFNLMLRVYHWNKHVHQEQKQTKQNTKQTTYTKYYIDMQKKSSKPKIMFKLTFLTTCYCWFFNCYRLAFLLLFFFWDTHSVLASSLKIALCILYLGIYVMWLYNSGVAIWLNNLEPIKGHADNDMIPLWEITQWLDTPL